MVMPMYLRIKKSISVCAVIIFDESSCTSGLNQQGIYGSLSQQNSIGNGFPPSILRFS